MRGALFILIVLLLAIVWDATVNYGRYTSAASKMMSDIIRRSF